MKRPTRLDFPFGASTADFVPGRFKRFGYDYNFLAVPKGRGQLSFVDEGDIMLKWFALLPIWLLFLGIGKAQDELIKNFSPSDFEKFIKEDLKKDFEKKTPTENRIQYTIKNTRYVVDIYTKGKIPPFLHCALNEVLQKGIDLEGAR